MEHDEMHIVLQSFNYDELYMVLHDLDYDASYTKSELINILSKAISEETLNRLLDKLPENEALTMPFIYRKVWELGGLKQWESGLFPNLKKFPSNAPIEEAKEIFLSIYTKFDEMDNSPFDYIESINYRDGEYRALFYIEPNGHVGFHAKDLKVLFQHIYDLFNSQPSDMNYITAGASIYDYAVAHESIDINESKTIHDFIKWCKCTSDIEGGEER